MLLFAGLNAGGFLETILIAKIFSSVFQYWFRKRRPSAMRGYLCPIMRIIEKVENRIMEIFGLEGDVLYFKGRRKIQVAARSLLCYWAVRELGLRATELAKRLGVTQPAVSYAVSRGERIAKERDYSLV
jgi:hypothetical protein